MKVEKITETEFRKMILTSSDRLNKNAEFINSLNVFPVPDGDTGTNMSLSFASGSKYVSESTSANVGDLAQALAKGLLMGARGNSGVILSQVFRGFAKSVSNKKELTPQDLAQALQGGVETAYKAVMKPQEGTILTVARKSAEAAKKVAKDGGDIVAVMKDTYEAAEAALKTTPDLLPVLKEVGVVDSGGQGLTFVYQGFYDALSGNVRDDEVHKPSPVEMDEMVSAEHHKSAQGKLNTEDIKYGYCTEIMVRLGAGRLVEKKFDYDEFRGYLAEIGDSLLVIADDEVVKVHVHTEHPGMVLSYGQKFGSLIKVKVDNMRLQHETILEKDEEEEREEEISENEISGDYGIIAVASGEGVAEIFKNLGATYVLSGGQTMNPSTQDIVDAIAKTKKDKVIILPNNKNIFLAADQAAEVCDVDAVVVPSKTIAQGMAAMLGFSKEADLEENKEAMTDELDTVISGQVTIAVRDTTIEGREIKKDDYMGIVDGNIVVTNPDRKEAAIEMVKAMLDEDSEVVTIIYGEDGNKEEAEAIETAVSELDEDLEIEIHEGNQPVYPYLISVE
ncbi:DAK2 domain-containing protein [Lactobacillus ruminis]|uniref:DAK2 domain-containing protein n=1 Tax=Ligilactobacillus ruminis TaxID=1623 RepID=UPI00101FABF6|nr:DAK2 domain-containing protein [Ligilactobacillus ruminis]MSB43258.1 DAK2 domain-containing protein [Ligilactobacillus ruminis]MSB53821.1 DAK2 domain-containing protein [Ligilactobacillus ruminis]MSB55624.1 DAK2 domain-containing protein [Ligilactobacillus ruminis]MSB80832.1 DAK2 domain-containing protein [Ligilactobacillus ruminis]MSB90504.1 DAK2 domain-containing protein [Ligilactobacillus ruminis]